MSGELTSMIGFRDKSKHYKVVVQCLNCSHSEEVEIPKGTLVGEHTKECVKCGCTTKQLEDFFKKRDGR